MRLLNKMGYLRQACLLVALCMVFPYVQAGNFGVSPIRIDLDRNARTGTIGVSNDEAAEPLRLQMQLSEWTQDTDGKDEYRPSDDLLYFPRVMALEKAERKMIRVGLRTPATTRERAYRLFIEELPPPPEPGAPGTARIAIAIRFGVPIFVKPPNEEVRGDIEKAELAKGKLRLGVRNSGNVHFRIDSITISSKEAFSREVTGWYLLAGAAREHVIELSTAECSKLKQLDVVVKTDKQLQLTRTLDVNASMCKP